MRSKGIRFSAIIPMLALGIMFVLAACEDNKDLYNPERVQEEAKKAFPVKDIDPNQTWETSAVCNASVSVNEKDGEIYTIKVYTSNPYNVNSSDVFLLAKTTVANGKTANFKFDIPAALQYVYVMKVNSEGYSSAVPVAVTDGNMNVTFGGESTETRMATTRGGDFPTMEKPGDDIFPTDAPDNCGNIDNYKDRKDEIPYLIENGTYNLPIDRGGIFYIRGEVTITSWDEPADGCTADFYLLPDAKLTLGMPQFNHRFNSVFSIGKGAELTANTLKGESGSKIFNKGTITTSKIEVTESYVHNAGTIETETVVLTNDLSKFCNATDGKLHITSNLTMQANSHFLNENDGSVVVDKETDLQSNNSWENAGLYTTNTMRSISQCKNIKNSCRLTVKDKFSLGDAVVYNESYIFCKDLDMQRTIVNMAVNSIFEVENEAIFLDSGERWDGTLGFSAPTTPNAWAILKMGKAKSGKNTAYKDLAYTGYLYIACNDHFPIGDQYNPGYKLEGGAVFAGTDNADIEIPHSQCSPGYKGTADEDKDDDDSDDKYPLLSYAYAFEDMTKEALTDYDFNDVVLYVTTPYKKGGQNVVDVTLKAAGASKQLTVFFKDLYSGTSPVAQNIFGEKGGEVHTVFGVEPGILINTGIPADTEAKTATKESVTVTVKVSDGFSITEHGDFYIVDEKGKEVHIPNFTPDFKKGNVPYAIRVASTTWKWAKERVSITEAYKGFEEWAQDAMKEPTWYDSPVSGNVY